MTDMNAIAMKRINEAIREAEELNEKIRNTNYTIDDALEYCNNPLSIYQHKIFNVIKNSLLLLKKITPSSCGRCRYNNSSCWCSLTNDEIDRDFEYDSVLDSCPFKINDKNPVVEDSKEEK